MNKTLVNINPLEINQLEETDIFYEYVCGKRLITEFNYTLEPVDINFEVFNNLGYFPSTGIIPIYISLLDKYKFYKQENSYNYFKIITPNNQTIICYNSSILSRLKLRHQFSNMCNSIYAEISYYHYQLILRNYPSLNIPQDIIDDIFYNFKIPKFELYSTIFIDNNNINKSFGPKTIQRLMTLDIIKQAINTNNNLNLEVF